MTTSLTIYKSKDQNFDFLSLLEKAKIAGIINEYHYYRYLADWQQKLYDLVLLYNHAQSTSLSKDECTFIHNCLNYVLEHGYDKQISLIDTSFIKIFNDGMTVLEQNTKKIAKTLEQIIAKPLSNAFEKYRELLYVQIPAYLDMLQSADNIFAHAYLIDDIIYPLIDGTPLQNNLYGLNGSDMVCYYLQCLRYETDICYFFSNDLDEFVTNHDRRYGIPFSDLDINILLSIIIQAIAHYWLYSDLGLYLVQDDIIKLKKILYFHDLHTALNDALMFFSQHFLPEAHAYLIKHYHLLYDRFLLFINENAEIFVCSSQKDVNKLLLYPTLNKKAFMLLLKRLESSKNTQEKIKILNETHLNIYDLMDLLDNDIFYDAEYHYYYQNLDFQEIALLLKCTFIDLSINEKLSRKAIAMLDPTSLWQEQLINFISSFDDTKLANLSAIMNSFEISK